MKQEFKPQKKPFIIISIAPNILGGLGFLILFYFASLFLPSPLLIFSLFFLLVLVINLFYLRNAYVKYKKRRYVFEEDRIIQYSGGIFSESQTELLIKNITHVQRVYPFFEYKIFKTGRIKIEAAGSRESEVKIVTVDNAEEIMSLVERTMIKNGFNLDKDDLRYSENPHPLGVFFDLSQKIIAALVVVFFIFSGSFPGFGALQGIDFWLFDYSILFFLVPFLILIPFIVWLVLSFLDLSRREYNIYSNIITYTEGFLTRRYAFIPFKNLSDSTTTQNIVDRIFELYDVKISCQGSGQEILFKNLRRGKEVNETLDYLIKSHKEKSEFGGPDQLRQTKEGSEAWAQKKTEVRQEAVGESGSVKTQEEEFVKEIFVNMSRHLFFLTIFTPLILVGFLFPLILLPVALIFLASFIYPFIEANFTRFYVKEGSMLRRYKFISSKDTEFNNEKITGLVIKRNLIDYYYKTFSVKFYSIGAGSDLEFFNIDHDDALVENILSKTGLKPQKKVFQIDSEFSFLDSLRSSLFLSLGAFSLLLLWLILASIYLNFSLAILTLVLLAFFYFLFYLYQVHYFQRSKLYFYEDVVHFQKGIFFKSFFYARYDNIKDISTTKYPLTDKGDLCFNIAGEKAVQAQQGQVVSSHNFTVKYVSNIPVQDKLIDFILLRSPRAEEINSYREDPEKYAPKILMKRRPSLKNPIFLTILFLMGLNLVSLFIFFWDPPWRNIFVFWILFLVLINVSSLLVVTVITLVKRFVIENTRVLDRSGVFYKKQTSVVFEKIDFLNNSQGFVNKLFRNGNVTVNTVGSSKAELELNNIDDYKEFYEKLHKVYKNFDLDG